MMILEIATCYIVITLFTACLRDCNSTLYTIEITHGQLILTNVSRKRYGIADSLSTESITTLHFYFPSLTQTIIVNKPESILKWIGKYSNSQITPIFNYITI